MERHTISVSVLKTGHSKFVSGTDTISNHWYGRGVDISAVDGDMATPSSSAARSLAIAALEMGPPIRPNEIGTPWPDLSGRGAFSDGAHQDHLHFGWSATPSEPIG